jgi:hypothetical protein
MSTKQGHIGAAQEITLHFPETKERTPGNYKMTVYPVCARNWLSVSAYVENAADADFIAAALSYRLELAELAAQRKAADDALAHIAAVTYAQSKRSR